MFCHSLNLNLALVQSDAIWLATWIEGAAFWSAVTNALPGPFVLSEAPKPTVSVTGRKGFSSLGVATNVPATHMKIG
jgi:hypothetical protein